MRVKYGYTVIALVLLIGLYIMIFRFSADDAERSSQISRAVTQLLKDIYDKLFSHHTDMIQEEVWETTFSVEAVVRKLAHFTEYLCVGFLSYSIARLWIPARWQAGIAVGVQLVISASLDEFHQYFVPGRYASAKDVLLDCAGGFWGMIVISLIERIYRSIKGYR